MKANTSGRVEAKTPRGLIWTRVGIMLLIAFVTWITISYCSRLYYNRAGAFHDALECSKRVLQEHGMQFWLQNGTLLGATRLGHLVLWDADLDFGVLLNDENKFNAVSEDLDRSCFGARATTRNGAQIPTLRIWRKCTRRLCAEFHETNYREGPPAVMVTGNGESPSEELFPLAACTVAGVESMCPHNSAYYLAQAYGSEWLTRPLTTLF